MFSCVLLAFYIPQTHATAYAETDYSWLTKKPSKDNEQGKMFQKYIKKFKVQARSLYKLLAVFLMTAVACATIFTGTSLTVSTSNDKRKAWQMKLIYILIVLIVFFCMSSIFSIAEKIGKTIFVAQ
jgi:steroid 5-alpha reductase family enzyme